MLEEISTHHTSNILNCYSKVINCEILLVKSWSCDVPQTHMHPRLRYTTDVAWGVNEYCNLWCNYLYRPHCWKVSFPLPCARLETAPCVRLEFHWCYVNPFTLYGMLFRNSEAIFLSNVSTARFHKTSSIFNPSKFELVDPMDKVRITVWHTLHKNHNVSHRELKRQDIFSNFPSWLDVRNKTKSSCMALAEVTLSINSVFIESHFFSNNNVKKPMNREKMLFSPEVNLNYFG